MVSKQGKPNTIELHGFDADNNHVFELNLSIAEFPKAKHLWDDPEYIRSHRIATLFGALYDERGSMDQEYERKFDSNGQYLGGTVKFANGAKVPTKVGRLEPCTIPHGQFVFTVHYLHQTSKPKVPEWHAFTLVVYDQDQRVYPVELFDFPKDKQPPAIDGTGATNFEAYRDVRNKLLELVPGEVPIV